MIERLFLAFVREVLAGERYFKSASAYLAKAKPESLQKDLENLAADLRKKRKNSLANAFAQFLSGDVSEFLDTLPKKNGGSQFPKSPLGNVLKEALRQNRPEVIARKASLFLAEFGRATVYVQTATKLDAKAKAKIRSSQVLDYVVFGIEKSLLGGIRVLKNGNIYDATWNTTLKTILNTSYAK